MFVSERWVAAFVDSLKAQGGEAEDGYQALKTLSSWVKSLPGAVFGSSAAERLEKLVREAMANASNGNAPKGSDASVGSNASSPALETALRLLVLMVRRNVVHHIDSVLDGVKKYLDRKNGVLAVSLEYAFPPGEDPGRLADEGRITEAVKKRNRAAKVELTEHIKPELIGGYRLRIGDEVLDASIRSQLRKLKAALESGETWAAGGSGAGNPRGAGDAGGR